MKETYNLWLGRLPGNYVYLATVVASNLEDAATRAIDLSGLNNTKLDINEMTYNGIPIHRNNPIYSK